MKSKIVRPDGTVIEIEGTQQEVADLLQKLAPAPFTWPSSVTTTPVPWAEIKWPAITYGPCQHRYPAVWMSVSPPQCEICHEPAAAVSPLWSSSGYFYYNNVAST